MLRWRIRGTTRGLCRPNSAIAISSIRSCRRIASRTSGADGWANGPLCRSAACWRDCGAEGRGRDQCRQWTGSDHCRCVSTLRLRLRSTHYFSDGQASYAVGHILLAGLPSHRRNSLLGQTLALMTNRLIRIWCSRITGLCWLPLMNVAAVRALNRAVFGSDSNCTASVCEPVSNDRSQGCRSISGM
jgi:hypothetical protein